MRLFVGINPSDGVRDAISGFIATLESADRADRGKIRFTSPDNIHLTLKFLGETDPARIPLIDDALSRISMEPFTVTVFGAGGFPSATNEAQILWTGTKRSEPLSRLAGLTERVLEPAGFQRETRPFAPHFTIARTRGKAGDGVIRLIRANGNTDFGSFDVDAVHLYVSESAPGGVRYRKLSRFGLAK
ncbi:MAG TPA: RNA 2',3'-cyclic phosphodiesterase [Spirochaetota bacterium]|nr:RNA 2',3'-cyclic phosphodiesterase [Spirochaetota bacterium]